MLYFKQLGSIASLIYTHFLTILVYFSRVVGCVRSRERERRDMFNWTDFI